MKGVEKFLFVSEKSNMMGVTVSILISLLPLTACSTSPRRTGTSVTVLSAEYWHAPPPAAVVELGLRIGMSGDALAKLVGVAEPAFISCLTAHLRLPDGMLSTRHDGSGRLVFWEIKSERDEAKPSDCEEKPCAIERSNCGFEGMDVK